MLALSLAAGGVLALLAELRARNAMAAATQVMLVALLAPVCWWLGQGVIGAGDAAANGLGAGHAAVAASGALFCLIAASAVTGALGERLRLGPSLILTVLIAGVLVPAFARLSGPGGWLGGHGFVDQAGAARGHVLGGALALAGVWVTGSRSGRYSQRGSLTLLRGSHPALAPAAMLLRWAGLLGLAAMCAREGGVASAVVGSLLAGMTGGLAALGAAWGGRRGLRVEFAARGVIAGAVTVAAGAGVLPPLVALFTGAAAGALSVGAQRLMLARGLDDAVGAASIHLVGGLIGLVAVGLFANTGLLATGLGRPAQLGVQLLGAGMLALFGIAAGYGFFRLLERASLLRAAPQAERVGLNLSEHASAPEPWTLDEALLAHAVPRRREAVLALGELVLAPGGAITRANAVASAIFGYGELELGGLQVDQLLASNHLMLLSQRTMEWREATGVRRSGEQFAMEIKFSEVEVNAAPDPQAETQAEPEKIVVASVRDVSSAFTTSLGAVEHAFRVRFDRELGAAGINQRSGRGEDDDFSTCRIAGHFPASESSWIEYLWTQDREALTFVLADLSGRVDAALLAGASSRRDAPMGLFLGNFRHPPERQLQNLAEVMNTIAFEVGRGDLRLALTLCHINLRSGDVLVLSAGRRTPVVCSTSGRARALAGRGAALGSSPRVRAEIQSGRLQPGDLAVLPATGLVDPFHSGAASFTSRELARLVTHGQPAGAVLERIMTRARLSNPGDDQGVLVFKRTG